MATIFRSATAEGIASGTALIDTNIGTGTGGNGFDAATNPSSTSLYSDAAAVLHGTVGYRCAVTTFATGKWTSSITGRPVSNVSVRGYFQYVGNLNTANHYLIQATTTTGALDWRLQFSAAHRPMLLNTGGNIWVEPTWTAVVGTWYRVDLSLISATSYRVQFFQGDGTTALVDTGVQTLAATIATNQVDVGVANSGSGVTTLYLDDWAVGTGGLIGRPSGLPWAAPTVTVPASVDKNVGDTFSLTGVPTLGDGSSITVHEWTILEQSPASPTITLTGASTATVSGTCSKAGALVLRYRAKDNGSALGSVDTWSAYATVTVYVSPDLGDKRRVRDIIGSTNWTAISTGSMADDLDTTGYRTPDDPVNEAIVLRMQPVKPGALVDTIRGLKNGAADITYAVQAFTDSTLTTQIFAVTLNPVATVGNMPVTYNPGALAQISTLAGCREITLKVTASKV